MTRIRAAALHGRSAGLGTKPLAVVILVAGCGIASCQVAETTNTDLSPTPPMGWANWNHFFCDYSEQTIREEADALVSTGMRELGYKYVLIQECIFPARGSNSELLADTKRFPHGLKTLVDYIHTRGLKAGIYTDIGMYTCYSNPRYQGSYHHEELDANLFAALGFDFIEMDYCNRPAGHTGREIYEHMAAAIRHTGRPMLLYICSWGNENPWTWAYGYAQLWRTDADISFDKNQVQWANIVQRFESNARHAVFSAPNSWNDPDMLEVGNSGINLTEARTHFSMWAVSAAPLWAGNDPARMSDDIRAIYTNPELIAIDQDPLGAGPVRIKEEKQGIQVWSKPLGSISSGVDALLLLNLTDAPADIGVQWKDLGLTGAATVRDLWAHADLGEFSVGYGTRIPSHGSVVWKVSGQFSWEKGATYEAEWPGNHRGPKTRLLPCPECSDGYAVSLRGTAAGMGDGALEFTHIDVMDPGAYAMQVAFVYNGLDTQTVEMRVNGSRPVNISFPNLIYGTVTLPVELRQGANSIAFEVVGKGTINLDRITLSR